MSFGHVLPNNASELSADTRVVYLPELRYGDVCAAACFCREGSNSNIGHIFISLHGLAIFPRMGGLCSRPYVVVYRWLVRAFQPANEEEKPVAE